MNIDAATLANAVRTVLPATRANYLPVLKGCWLESTADGLAVTATDLDLTISTAAADAGTPLGACVVPATLLSGWLEGRVGDVSLELDDNDLVLTGDTGAMRLRTLPLEEWPRCEQAQETAQQLDARIANILYAASRDGARPILNGVGLGDGWACCTDSYQLSAVRVAGPTAIVPVRALELALKGEGEATIAVDERRCTITVGPAQYTARLIEGTFPNWQGLVGEPTTTVIIDRDAAIAALERTLVLCDAETPVRVTPDGEGLTFSVVSRDVGEVMERVAGGSDLGGEYGFRPRLLLNLLRSRDEAKVEVGVTDQFKPVSVRDDNSVALVMPVRLS
jgi:DNA polymerase III subunit beta